MDFRRRILMVEDSALDARLATARLAAAGLNAEFLRVDTAAALETALEDGTWDAVLSDYNLPSFSALDALRILQRRGLDLPFIVISGGIREEEVSALMKAGAHNYVLKDHLRTLGDVLEKELKAAEQRREQRQRQEEIRQVKERLEVTARRMLDAQELERQRLARELHGGIGQMLTAIKIHLQGMVHFPDPAALPKQLENTIGTVDAVLQQVRTMSTGLRPALLDDLGLVVALRAHVEQQSKQSGVPMEFAVRGEAVRLGTGLETACFRVAQAALSNAVRHAQARKVTVELRWHPDLLQLLVKDDGVSFDTVAARKRAENGGTYGILEMNERTALLNGRLELHSHPGQGTEVRAEFPLTPVATEP